MTDQVKVLCLRTVDKDRKSYNGFQWPETGEVVAPDWDPKPECGNGLHGLLKGEGDASLLRDEADTIWQVVEADLSLCVELSGKVKFPRCVVVFSGGKEDAIKLIKERHPEACVVFGTATAGYRGTATAGDSGTATAGDCGTATAGNRGTATAGDSGTATAGYCGTATAGYCGTATAGYCGTATAGDCGTATAGNRGTATAGYRGTATAGDSGTATAGNRGTATAGDSGTATAGDSGTATAGYRGTATAGYCGTATAGDCGTATAGEFGCVSIRYWDGTRYRMTIGYIGENGLEPNVKYRLDDNHRLVKV